MTGGASPQSGVGAELQSELGQAFGQWREPEQSAEAPTRDAGRDAPHEDRAAGVPDSRGDPCRDHAREGHPVPVVDVGSLFGHGPAPVDVAAIDLHLVADRDVRAGERPRARWDHPIAGRAQVNDIEVPPRDAVLGDHQVIQVGRGTRLPGMWTRGVPGRRAEDATDRRAVRVVGDGALLRAMTGGREHDRVATACVEPAGAHTPQLLAGEDRRVVDRRGPVGLGRSPDRQDADPDQQSDQEDEEQVDRADARSRTCPGHSSHSHPHTAHVALMEAPMIS